MRRNCVTKTRFRFAVLGVAAWASWSAAAAHDQIVIVGSSTVYPFSALVADHFAKSGPFKMPSVRASSTSEGFQLLCSGSGADSPDIVAASRSIAASERSACETAGVRHITEIQIGYDSLILAGSASRPAFNVTLEQFWRAVAKFVPINGAFAANPYHNWREIAATLPDQPIVLLGPAAGHGTRDALVSLVMEPSCAASEAGSKLSAQQRELICAALFGGAAMDAFTVAFRIPNLLRDLFAEHWQDITFGPVAAAGSKICLRESASPTYPSTPRQAKSTASPDWSARDAPRF